MLAAIYIYIYAEVLDQGEPLSTLNFVQCVLKFCRVAILTDNPKLLWYESITGDMYRSESREYWGAAWWSMLRVSAPPVNCASISICLMFLLNHPSISIFLFVHWNLYICFDASFMMMLDFHPSTRRFLRAQSWKPPPQASQSTLHVYTLKQCSDLSIYYLGLVPFARLDQIKTSSLSACSVWRGLKEWKRPGAIKSPTSQNTTQSSSILLWRGSTRDDNGS